MNDTDNKNTLLALDPSSKATGWSIYEGDQLKEHGVITAGSSNLFRRIDKMVEGVEKLIQDYKVTEVALENVIPDDVRHNQNVYDALKYLQGFLLYTFDKHKINKIKMYVASEWRKRCGIGTGPGIKRQSLKPQDIAFVKEQYGISVSDDEADAIAIGFAHTHKPLPIKIRERNVEIIDGFEFG